MRNLEGGVYSFHQFLSIANDQGVILSCAQSSRDDSDLLGIVFHINIDLSSLRSVLSARLDEHRHFTSEKELSFTMYTMFRVGEVLG